MPDVKAKTTSANGEISCSVEETNRMRQALGLKPLRVEQPPSPQPAPIRTAQVAEELRARLQASRVVRKARKSALAPRSIAEQALHDDDDDHQEDPARWVDKSRHVSAPSVASSRSAKVAHVIAPDVELRDGASKTLTLRDVDVVADQHDVLEDDVTAAANLRRPLDDEINHLAYDGSDTAQFSSTALPLGGQSVADLPRNIESDYKSEPMFRKVKKRSKKRRRVSEEPVVRGKVDALRKAEDAKISEESDDDDHYEFIRKAAAKAAEREVDGTVKRILKAVERAERGDDTAMDDGASVVREEMSRYLQSTGNIVGAESDSDNEPEREKERAATTRLDPEEADVMSTEKEQPQKNSAMEIQRATEATTKPSASALPSVPAVSAPIIERGAETNGMTGVAATLAKLRSRGELKHKVRQKGRARDKPFDDGEANVTGRKEIKLSYLDEFGNQLTPKEAFRVLCHSFHGKEPGQNKREKRLRKMLEAAKQRKVQVDDTPLASAALLKEETRRRGNAHIVISGTNERQESQAQEKGEANGKP